MRGWIQDLRDIEQLQNQLKEFLGGKNVEITFLRSSFYEGPEGVENSHDQLIALCFCIVLFLAI